MAALVPVLNQMMFLFTCILIGFLLNRLHVLPENADTVISKSLNFVFVPALVINSFRQNCTFTNLAENTSLLFYNIALLVIVIAVAYVLAPLFTKKKEEVGLYRYSFAIVNFGFMGNAVVQGLLGDEWLFHYLIFTIPANIFTYCFGVIWLTAGKKKFSWTMFLNPMFFSLAIGIFLGLTRLPLPSFLNKALDGCAACFSPLAMILTGFVVGSFNLGSLIRRVPIYVVTLIRVILMPLAIFGLCLLFKVPSDVRVLIMVFSAMPLGLNTIVFPAAYGGDKTIGASMALISNVIGIVTVPVIMSLVL